MKNKNEIKEVIPEPPVDEIQADTQLPEPPVDEIQADTQLPEPPVDEIQADTQLPEPPVDEIQETAELVEITVDSAIAALETAKEQVVTLLGTDAEHLFEPIDAALNYKAKQIGGDESFAGLSNDEAAQKQVEEKEAKIAAMQEAANKLLEQLRQPA